jgi:hypothetical protein
VTTAALRPTTRAPLEPVMNALAVMAERYPVHGLARGLVVADERGWTPASALRDDAGLTEFLAAAQRRWPAAPHVAAALAWKCYSYWAAVPAVLGYATALRVPLVRADDVLVRFYDRAPFLRLSLRHAAVTMLPGDPYAAAAARVVADEAALLRELRESLLDGHLGPFAEGISRRARLGRRTLLGSLAAGVGHALSRSAQALPPARPALPTAEAILDALGVADLVELTPRPHGRLFVQRRTCCLAFALPHPRTCVGCCIKDA